MHPPAVPSPINCLSSEVQLPETISDGVICNSRLVRSATTSAGTHQHHQQYQPSSGVMFGDPPPLQLHCGVGGSHQPLLTHFPNDLHLHMTAHLEKAAAAGFGSVMANRCRAPMPNFISMAFPKPSCPDLIQIRTPFPGFLRDEHPNNNSPFYSNGRLSAAILESERSMMAIRDGTQVARQQTKFEMDPPILAGAGTKFSIDSILSISSEAASHADGDAQHAGNQLLYPRRLSSRNISGKSHCRANKGQNSRGKTKSKKQGQAAMMDNNALLQGVVGEKQHGLHDGRRSRCSEGSVVAKYRNDENHDEIKQDDSREMGVFDTVTDGNDDNTSENSVPQNASGGSHHGNNKRVRTIFTPDQLEKLEEEFHRQQYMVGPERLFLAASLRLTEAQVKVWFQNRRIKWRKQQLELQQMKVASWRDQHDGYFESDD